MGFSEKRVWSSCVSCEHSSSTMSMPIASSSSTCIMLSEGPESTDIDLEQAQQKSASILNVLRAPIPADIISKECLTPTIYVLWQITVVFLV